MPVDPRWSIAAVLLGVSGCAEPVVPDPRAATEAYARAIESGDAQAVYGMMTERAKTAYGLERTRELIADSRPELLRRARALSKGPTDVEAVAEVPFEDGERAILPIENGRFRIAAAGALPAGARTPAQALAELRQVLARRSYAGLVRVLSAETRGALERDVSGLVAGLEHPETLEVEISGDRAEVSLPGGHKVWLKRQAGVWRVHDFQ